MRLLRIVLSVIIMAVSFELDNIINLLLTNRMAMYQMNSTDTGYVAYQLYNNLHGYFMIIPVIMIVLLMLPEIKALLKKIGGF
ncbi:hypothetical protein BX659_14210 [Orenia metallireducens]|uniref:Uncharacterized protein n=1 Tax=Orenia metallireducens TaxID=1413210 RepID=A0A285IFJ6_9FIRM|nr:hypothetical protein [Orenia metallireducens]PRX18521.1 hypothetical protein BX659_14210 [Orenia metallireducens]SNY46567.1 hypothetical protein SAMN06265827_14310 [Orenia metallireducens]